MVSEPNLFYVISKKSGERRATSDAD
ncbi:hypothetical protein ACV357_35045, partial [Pseudomonas aeruginosa]